MDRVDFDPSVITVRFEADEGGQQNNVSSPVPIFDDDIDEANEEFFVMNLRLTDSVSGSGIVISRPNSLGIIRDNDSK